MPKVPKVPKVVKVPKVPKVPRMPKVLNVPKVLKVPKVTTTTMAIRTMTPQQQHTQTLFCRDPVSPTTRTDTKKGILYHSQIPVGRMSQPSLDLGEAVKGLSHRPIPHR